jgi:DNA (cytosine-5)-methyltransferase 1
MKFIDLFAGIGGFRLAMESVGGTCVFSSEWDKYAQQTYKANFGEVPAGDITKIEASNIPPHDVLCAGFPCQTFSIAGNRAGFEDTRGTMFFEIARIAKHHKPKILFLENVQGLLSHEKGKTFKTIVETLQDLGYTVYHKVLRSKDFGVPQLRPRLFIIALANTASFVFPEPLNIKTCVGDILENKVDSKYFLSNKKWAGCKAHKLFNKSIGNGFGYSLVNHESVYANTLTARYYKDGSEILVQNENNNPRKLTPRECARLQGYTDSFIIPVSDTQAYKQFGNSVTVNVVKAIAQKIKETYEKF